MMIVEEKNDRLDKMAALRGPKPGKIGLKCLNYSTSKLLQVFSLNDAYDL